MSELFTPYPGDRCSICGVKDDRLGWFSVVTVGSGIAGIVV